MNLRKMILPCKRKKSGMPSEKMREVLRIRHYLPRTEAAYPGWVQS